MYGTFETNIIGRIGEEIVLRQSEGGKQYCYFRVSIPRRPQVDSSGEKKERDPLWLNLSANGPTAVYLSRYAKKGMWIKCECSALPSTSTKEKDGVKTVYNDWTFYITGGRCDIIGYTSMEKPENSGKKPEANPTERPAAEKAAQVPSTNPANDYDDEESCSSMPDDGLVNMLPF